MRFVSSLGARNCKTYAVEEPDPTLSEEARKTLIFPIVKDIIGRSRAQIFARGGGDRPGRQEKMSISLSTV
jgi:hypothetical protein